MKENVTWFINAGSHELDEYFKSDAYKDNAKPDYVKLQECRDALKVGLDSLINEADYVEINIKNLKLIYKEALRLSHRIENAAEYKPELAAEFDNSFDELRTSFLSGALAQNQIVLLEQWNPNSKNQSIENYPNALKQEFSREYNPVIQVAPAVVIHAAPPQQIQQQQQQPNQPQPEPTVQSYLDNIGFELEADNNDRWQYIIDQYHGALKIVGDAGKAKLQADIISKYPKLQLEFRVNVFGEDSAAVLAEMKAASDKLEYERRLNQLSVAILGNDYDQIEANYNLVTEYIRVNFVEGATVNIVRTKVLASTKDKVELEMRIRKELFKQSDQEIADEVAGRVYAKLERYIKDGKTVEFKELFESCSPELKAQLLSDKGNTQNLFKPAMLRGNKEIYGYLKEKAEPAPFIFDSISGGGAKWELFDGQELPKGDREYFAREIEELIKKSSKEQIDQRCLLNIAAYFGATGAVQAALDKGADPAVKGSRYSNALNVAGNMAKTPQDLSFKRDSYVLIAKKCFDLIENGPIEDRAKYRNAVADSGALHYLYDDGTLRDFEKFLESAEQCNVPLTVRKPSPNLRTGQMEEPREGRLLEGDLLKEEITAWFMPFNLAGVDDEKNKLALQKFKLLVNAGIIDMRAIDRFKESDKDDVIKNNIDVYVKNNPRAAEALAYAKNAALINQEVERNKATKKNTDNLRAKLVTEPEKQLVETQEKWTATLKTPEPTGRTTPEERAELERNKLKSAALKRMMLFYGCSGLSIEGHTLDESGSVTTSKKSATENNLPMGAYFSGHMGRCYVDLNDGPSSDQVLKYITTGDPESTAGIHYDRHLKAKNREDKLEGNQIVFDRHSATHAGISKKGKQLKEEKGVGYGAKGFIEGVAYKIRSPFSSKHWKETHHTKHMGMNIAAGGLGNPHYSTGEVIKGSGEDGHMYFNTGTNSFGAGLEGTAPGTAGPLGEHSKTGAADEFTAFEGAKYAIAKKNTKGLKSLFEEQIKLLLPSDPNLLNKLQGIGLKVGNDGKIEDIKAFKEFLKKDAMLQGLCELLDLKTYTKGSLHVVTPFGRWLMEQGVAIQNNYNGALGKVDETRFQEIISAFSGREIPDEIVYFKPRENVLEFVAQEAIYKNIDEKPLLTAHPELSYEASNMIGKLYNSLPDAKAKAALDQLEKYMSDPKFSRQVVHDIALKNDSELGVDSNGVKLALSAIAAEKRSADRIANDKAEEARVAAAAAAVAAAPPAPVVPPVTPATVRATVPPVAPPPPSSLTPVKPLTPPPPPASSKPAKTMAPPPPPPSVQKPPATTNLPATKQPEEEIKTKSRITQMVKVAGVFGAFGTASAMAFGVCLVVGLFVPGAQVALPFLLSGAAAGIGVGIAIGAVAAVLKLGDMAIEGIKSVFSPSVSKEPVVQPTPQRTVEVQKPSPPPPPTPPIQPSRTPPPQPSQSSSRVR